MNAKRILIGLVVCLAIVLGSFNIVSAEITLTSPATLLTSGLEGASGSTVGPDGALYVPEGAAGRITRVDPQTGEKTTFAEGLPKAIFPIGGVVDVAFIGNTAYALVTMVGSDIGGNDVVGIYRVDGPNSFTAIADLGEFAIKNPSGSEVFIATGVHYAMEPFTSGFLVTDGHHNRVLRVILNKGKVMEFKSFGNIVPTGLARAGKTVYMAQAGPVPHLPEDGKVVSFSAKSSAVKLVASGAPLLVDVEFGPGGALFALAQGFWDGVNHGDPATEDSGELVMVNEDGSFTVLAEGLDRPTSFEFIGNSAYVVTFDGEIWKIEDVFAIAP